MERVDRKESHRHKLGAWAGIECRLHHINFSCFFFFFFSLSFFSFHFRFPFFQFSDAFLVLGAHVLLHLRILFPTQRSFGNMFLEKGGIIVRLEK